MMAVFQNFKEAELNRRGQFLCVRDMRAGSQWAAWALAGLLAVIAVALPVASNTPHARSKAAVTARAPVKTYGLSTAPITMEVFTDYECPTCAALYEQTLKLLINDYVASGKVYLIHHDFPLTMHKYSGQAARWANAGAEAGQFEAVEAALYDNQNGWASDGNIEKYISGALSAPNFKRVQKLMEGCELPGPTSNPNGGFNASPHPCALDTYIEQDIAIGEQVPVKATPTYVISYKGQKLPPATGLVSWPILKQFFDSLLAQ
jgi:protein-disulfide isomerase